MTPHRIVIAGWLVFLLFAFPGFMTTESVDQMLDANVGHYSDWYAPSMSAIWRRVGYFIAGPSGMLVLQSGLFIAGAFSLLRRVLPERRAAIGAAAMLCFPPVAVTLAVVWRDAQLAGFLLAGAAALTSERRPLRVGGLLLLLLGATMRHGAVVAVLPLVLVLFRWRTGERRLVRAGIALGAWLAIVLGAHLVDRILLDDGDGYDRDEIARAQLDILGTVRYAESTSDAVLLTELERAGLRDLPAELHAEVRIVYRYPDLHWRVLPMPESTDAARRAAIVRARDELRSSHPGAYLTHRGLQLRILLGLRNAEKWQPVYVKFVERPEHRLIAHHRATYSWVQSQLIGVAEEWPAFFFRPYLYAFLAMVLVPFAIRRRNAFAGALLASGLLYEIALGFTLAAPEYRHSHWMIACTAIAAVMLAAGRRGRPAAAPASP